MAPRPLIGIPACRKLIDPHPYHCVGEKYIAAVVFAVGGLPALVPTFGPELEARAWLEALDGLLLTGSPSNVEPHHYGGPPSAPGTAHDPARDATTLALIRGAVAAGLPVFAICRGFQEMNVAFGGTLHQQVQAVAGYSDHREDTNDPLEVQYAARHEVALTPGGTLAQLAGTDTVRVNSLHSQGVDRLAPGLAVEATAPDGLVEAFRVQDATQFALGVQWHPEWKVLDNPFSSRIFEAFGHACRQYKRDSANEHHHVVV